MLIVAAYFSTDTHPRDYLWNYLLKILQIAHQTRSTCLSNYSQRMGFKLLFAWRLMQELKKASALFHNVCNTDITTCVNMRFFFFWTASQGPGGAYCQLVSPFINTLIAAASRIKTNTSNKVKKCFYWNLKQLWSDGFYVPCCKKYLV